MGLTCSRDDHHHDVVTHHSSLSDRRKKKKKKDSFEAKRIDPVMHSLMQQSVSHQLGIAPHPDPKEDNPPAVSSVRVQHAGQQQLLYKHQRSSVGSSSGHQPVASPAVSTPSTVASSPGQTPQPQALPTRLVVRRRIVHDDDDDLDANLPPELQTVLYGTHIYAMRWPLDPRYAPPPEEQELPQESAPVLRKSEPQTTSTIWIDTKRPAFPTSSWPTSWTVPTDAPPPLVLTPTAVAVSKTNNNKKKSGRTSKEIAKYNNTDALFRPKAMLIQPKRTSKSQTNIVDERDIIDSTHQIVLLF